MTNLEKWLLRVKWLPSPAIIKEWFWYFTCGAALERRVWSTMNIKQLFPNLFLFIVCPPGVGKTVIGVEALKLLKSLTVIDNSKEKFGFEPKKTCRYAVCPDASTFEAMLIWLEKNAKKKFVLPTKGVTYKHTSAAILLPNELGSMLKDGADDIATFLLQAYDCGDYDRITKHQGDDILRDLCISICGSCQPNWIKDMMNKGLLGKGFFSRTLMLYSNETSKKYADPIIEPEQENAERELRAFIVKLSNLYGKVDFTPDAWEAYNDWFNKEKYLIRTNHSAVLDEYYNRKDMHFRKLVLVKHFSESASMTITLDPVIQAERLLNELETQMHRVLNVNVLNPEAILADELKDFVRTLKRATLKDILARFHSQHTLMSIKSSLDFLVSTEQLVKLKQGTTDYYMIKFSPRDLQNS